MERLFPDPGPASVDQQVAGLELAEHAEDDRPYVITNFALTLDGRATIGGRSGQIGSDTDTAMLVGLRTAVDAVMIGAGTMRAERYGPPVSDPRKRERRVSLGLAPDPLMVIVGSLDLPWDAPLFTEAEGEVVIFTGDEGDPPPTATSLAVERSEGMVDLTSAMGNLRQERGIRSVLCEGGPGLHAQLIERKLIDELFVTHAPKLAGGEGPGLVSGLPERERDLQLLWLLHEPETGELFARYRVPAA
jgi:riboflavin-specific deaminase-like protein